MKHARDAAGHHAQIDLFGDAGEVDATDAGDAAGTADAGNTLAAASNDGEAAGGPAPSAKRARKRALPVAAPEFDNALAALGQALPAEVHLGTSTWSFPGWKGIVYRDEVSNAKLSREGLHAYGQHPVLGCVGIDRSFYAPLTVAQYARHAAQVPDTFRFVVKAPASVCDASIRGPRGGALMENAAFLNAEIARDEFVLPCLEGLGHKAGALVFQLSPLTPKLLADPTELIERLAAFFAALPTLDTFPGSPVYAIEIRDAVLLTPRFIRMLREARVRYCIGIHARMPEVLRQAAALALLDDDGPGPLVARWSLHAGFEYETAKAKYEPFDRIVDADPSTRNALAELAARYAIAGQPVLITVNNKAEGSAPLSCIELAGAIVDAVESARDEPATPATPDSTSADSQTAS
ncbi:MAG TPA: DUF72 domain-containing protein [Pararobbsia sp.]|nr:DUF72 domain-containing protein [Pararobbsia sp.]